jgi:hypothetical protein
MALNVTIYFADNTPMTQNVMLQLMSAGSPVASAPVGANGVVSFANVDPGTLSSPAVRLDPVQPSAPRESRGA